MYIYVDKYLIYGKIREVKENNANISELCRTANDLFGQKTNTRQRRKHEKR